MCKFVCRIPFVVIAFSVWVMGVGSASGQSPNSRPLCHSDLHALSLFIRADSVWLDPDGAGGPGFPVRFVPPSGTRDEQTGAPSSLGEVVTGENSVVRSGPGFRESFSAVAEGIVGEYLFPSNSMSEDSLAVAWAFGEASVADGDRAHTHRVQSAGLSAVFAVRGAIDATGKELPVMAGRQYSNRVEYLVEDEDAVYPIRVTASMGTFDARWDYRTGIIDDVVRDSAGNIYIAGAFTNIGSLGVQNVAKWDGKSWSALGDGIQGYSGWPYVLAVDDQDRL